MISHQKASGLPLFLGISPPVGQEYIALTDIWERAVRATHTFLTEEAILEIRNDIYDIYLRSMDVFVLRLMGGGEKQVSGLLYRREASRSLMERAWELLFQEPKQGAGEFPPAIHIPLGFIGLSGTHVNMLFVDPHFHRLGLGKILMTYALDQGALSVDVNEQNPGAYAFYKTLGFRLKGRSTHDAQGNPFPLLHLHLSP